MVRFSEQWKILNKARDSAPTDLRVVASALGVKVREAYVPKGISGMIEADGKGGHIITINANDPPTRKRFTLAHELGHYMLHRDLIGDGLDDDRLYRSTEAGKYHNMAVGPQEEIEANRFAAKLLMPEKLVRAKYDKTGSARETARHFGVSEHAMSIVLGIPYQKPEPQRA